MVKLVMMKQVPAVVRRAFVLLRDQMEHVCVVILVKSTAMGIVVPQVNLGWKKPVLVNVVRREVS